jgi:hypothetical protein
VGAGCIGNYKMPEDENRDSFAGRDFECGAAAGVHKKA